MSDSILDMLEELRNKVLEISCYEEFASEIEAMSGKSKAEILEKLRLIVVTKKISDFGKRRLYSLILSLKNLDEQYIQLFAMVIGVELVENQKREIEPKIEEMLEAMKNSEDDSWTSFLELALYFDDLGKSKYEFMKKANFIIERSIEQKKEGQIIDIDINTIFEALKNSNTINENREETLPDETPPGFGGRS